ncbi:MAG: SWIM zinc finger family protein, partial [Acidimicrobiales bacterium]
LVSQIEAELSSGSRTVLRRLLAQLTSGAEGPVEDRSGAAFDPDGFDGPESSYRDPDDLDDEDREYIEDPDPYWYAQRSGLSRPLRVEGGLSAKSQRGPIGESWWSKRFLDAVETALVGGRSTRGRSYARKGQVIDISVEPGLISARVQGSRRVPYKVRLAMPVASDEQWGRALASLAGQAVYSASMLAGELPHEVEEEFAGAGTALFPSVSSRLSTDCTCPDWANPCKHVAAVCYLVAEHFDRDPFALLAWRGRGRDELLGELRQRRGAVAAEPEAAPAARSVTAPPLAECLLGFWKAGPELASVHVRPVVSEAAGAVLRQLGRGFLEVRGRDVGELLVPAYGEMAAAAHRRALGGSTGTAASAN